MSDESSEARTFRVTADATLRTQEVLTTDSAEAAAQAHERALKDVAGQIGADLRDVEILEVDELAGGEQ